MTEDLIVQGAELAPTTLFGTNNPAEALAQMTEVATTLAEVVRSQNLIVQIGQSEHVKVEGWAFLGSLLGVFPVVVWTHPVMRDDVQVGWEARVEARTRGGEVVGAAEAECLTDERTWKGRDDYARRSMAQTRAVSKALRLPLGFVMQLAGFNPTPADEMPVVDMNDPDIPFGDAAAPQLMPPEPKKATEAKKKKLDVLIKATVKPPLARVYATVAQMHGGTGEQLIASLGARDADGVVHWAPLRNSITDKDASALIDKLETLEAAAVSGNPSETCPTCHGSRWVDENGNPSGPGRSDSYECSECAHPESETA